jgi:cell pole-organizing protein PopZ
MADQNQPEPSMEEILASIRRIISEEAPDKQGGQPQPAPARAHRETPPAAAEPDGGGDVLVLTEMVADDGSVVRVDETPPLAPERRRGSVTPLRPDPVEATEGAAGFQEEPAARVRQKPPPPLPDTPGVAVEEPRAMPRPAAAKDNGLLSRKAAEATAAAFAELSSGLRREPAAAMDGQDVTLEAFVRRCLEPMLHQWLDANLPGIIERLMKEEMERVARASRG